MAIGGHLAALGRSCLAWRRRRVYGAGALRRPAAALEKRAKLSVAYARSAGANGRLFTLCVGGGRRRRLMRR